MGDPHQAYLVARIPHRNKDGTIEYWKYVCVAGLYHHNSDGAQTLRSIHRFTTLAKQPDNAEIIREELRLIGEGSGSRKPLKGIPSRYLARLLSCAFNLGLEESPVHCCNFSLDEVIQQVEDPLWDCDNSEGLSFIDVTDPGKCAYCLVPNPSTLRKGEVAYVVQTAEEFIRSWCRRVYGPHDDSGRDSDRNSGGSMESGRDPDRDSEDESTESDFSEDDYYSHWYTHPHTHMPTQQEIERDNKIEKEVNSTVSLMEEIPYLDPDILCEVWPEDFPRRITFRSQGGTAITRTVKKSLVFSSTPRLMDLTFDPALRYVLDVDDAFGLESLLRLEPTPARAKAVSTGLSFPNSLTSVMDTSISLIAEHLRMDWDQVSLDLSYLPLRKDQILSMAEYFPGIQTLKLSHNPILRVDTVQAVLETITTLKRLVLLDTSITEEEWAVLFADHPRLFYNIHGVVHPCLLQTQEAFYRPAFTFHRSQEYRRYIASLPFFTNDLLVERLTTYMRDLADCPSNAVDGLLSAQPVKPGSTWERRSIPFFARPTIQLRDEGVLTGWVFLLSVSGDRNFYGFVKLEDQTDSDLDNGSADGGDTSKIPGQGTVSPGGGAIGIIYDINGFIEELVNEGRPPFSEDAIRDLTWAFTVGTRKPRMHPSGYKICGFCPLAGLISQKEATRLIFPKGGGKVLSKKNWAAISGTELGDKSHIK